MSEFSRKVAYPKLTAGLPPQKVEFAFVQDGYSVHSAYDVSVPSRRCCDVSSLSKAVQSVFNEATDHGGVIVHRIRNGTVQRYYISSFAAFVMAVESIAVGVEPKELGLEFRSGF